MICYQLLCEYDHGFEAWFKDSASFDEQAAKGEVQCPFCGNDHIRKAVMAPAVSTGKSSNTEAEERQQRAIEAAEQTAQDLRGGADPQEAAQAFMEVVTKLQKHVEETHEYVGENFADEARAIHYGDSEEREIYGEASAEETQELREEGIDVLTLPKIPNKENAN